MRTGAVLALGVLIASATAVAAQERGSAGLLRFDRTLLLEDSAATSANVSVGDVDRDGHLDIVLVKGRHWPLLDPVLIGDGRGGFALPRPIGDVADRSYSGVLADMDAAGDLDVVISNDRPDAKVVHLNDGKSAFSLGSTFGLPEWPTRHVGVADLNADGLPDVVLANRTGNRGGGRFQDPCLGFSQESAATVTRDREVALPEGLDCGSSACRRRRADPAM